MRNNLIIKEQKMNDEFVKQIIDIDKLFYGENFSFDYYREFY